MAEGFVLPKEILTIVQTSDMDINDYGKKTSLVLCICAQQVQEGLTKQNFIVWKDLKNYIKCNINIFNSTCSVSVDVFDKYKPDEETIYALEKFNKINESPPSFTWYGPTLTNIPSFMMKGNIPTM